MKEVSSLRAEIANASDLLSRKPVIDFKRAPRCAHEMERDPSLGVGTTGGVRWVGVVDQRSRIERDCAQAGLRIRRGLCLKEIGGPRSRAEIHDGVRSLIPLATSSRRFFAMRI